MLIKRITGLTILVTILHFTACKKEEGNNNNAGYTKGKNRFTVMVDNVEREYYVHIPADYTGNAAVPLVFVLHGTSGNGEKFYDISGWKELGEEENFISVYPSSGRYKIFNFGDSTVQNTTKWNILPEGTFIFMPGYTGLDDIKFLKKVVLEMQLKFNIDTGMIYMNGFSNGGQMAAKCAVEMSNIFAAVASNASTFNKDTVYAPQRRLPVLFQIGNEDYGPGNTGPAIPLNSFSYVISTPDVPVIGGKYYNKARKYINNFSLDSVYTISGDTNSVMVASYHSLTPGDTLNVFRYVFVKNLGHIYPNGINHWMNAPRHHWAWMRQYRKP
ncbi:MAG TPA: hypothetical protein PKG90_08515 [Chitinophagaceae bacterium]|nr:hypothetical protein [Chitinophagaceae bacterium]HNU13761.1 hypothetical protein [Chitinophagaceae bacterium]